MEPDGDRTIEVVVDRLYKATGAEAIATSCPYCEQNLNDPIQRNHEKMKLYDLTDLMLMAMDG